LAKTCPVV